ncbi:hypothetical protein GLYMA_07G185200v4 [Glycine max]|uniref:Protein FW2.2-like 6 n=2 Tax=Glycine subgen. Soja TaxID=1462606 RepID=I1KL83_SOYBN|nr:protein FW2.2-like 6 isoform 1 [Glycine max]XP_028240906.1 protein PLANT CADMIUM RESISTANCE 2-like isoform X1 [Glycine soja]KAG5010485.1 hypothetical protein JHK87_019000 [Glycine soja]KAG5023230.1 hypothetical protein JHK85_019572 [Glycine max]KAG5038314.1 hypothetical protein JHK86_019154 [Glycine max]KAH1087479.1 hypothetical protein GYH30_018847 [Glycine max]KAH1242824.1 Protein PLANT CADMIUM RESISTANCE 2 [Glycine max]|eukprot:NP_001238213.2 FWL family protein FWL6 isoform 1 [Glycine max]
MSEKAALGSWSSGLCGCFSDCSSCCLTFWCPCASFGRIGEIVDKGTTSCCLHGSLFCLLGGFSYLAGIYACMYRTKIRRQYGIEGHQCADFLLSCFCSACTLCQEYRELQARGFDVSAECIYRLERECPNAHEWRDGGSGSERWHEPLGQACLSFAPPA